MIVSLKKVFLRNKSLEAQPWNQRESPFYQKVRDSIKEKGIINPLLCIETQECEGQKFFQSYNIIFSDMISTITKRFKNYCCRFKAVFC